MDGLKFRRKLRIRRYELGDALTDETPVFVEIKQRIDRVTQKRRVSLPYAEALRLCNDRQIPEHQPGDETILEGNARFVVAVQFAPGKHRAL